MDLHFTYGKYLVWKIKPICNFCSGKKIHMAFETNVQRSPDSKFEGKSRSYSWLKVGFPVNFLRYAQIRCLILAVCAGSDAAGKFWKFSGDLNAGAVRHNNFHYGKLDFHMDIFPSWFPHNGYFFSLTFSTLELRIPQWNIKVRSGISYSTVEKVIPVWKTLNPYGYL